MYWDASAIVPLLVREGATDVVESLYARHSRIVTWWGTRVEIRSALERRRREPAAVESGPAEATLSLLIAGWSEIAPIDTVRTRAEGLLARHSLRAVDALQLSAAVQASDDDPTTLAFVTLDRQLAVAAARLGFPLPLNELTPGLAPHVATGCHTVLNSMKSRISYAPSVVSTSL